MCRFCTVLLMSLLLMLSNNSFAQSPLSINGFKYFFIGDPKQEDKGGVLTRLGINLQNRGLIQIAKNTTLSEEERTKVFNIGYTWHSKGSTFYIDLKAYDDLSKRTIVESHGSATAFGAISSSTVERAIEEAAEGFNYKGFSQEAYNREFRTRFPSMPKFPVDEKAFRESSLNSWVEGIWADNRYTIIIMKDAERKYGDYVGIILSCNTPLWEKGELKCFLRETATDKQFLGTWYMGNKSTLNTNFIVEGATFKVETKNPTTQATEYMTLTKLFPKMENSAAPSAGGNGGSQSIEASSSGTGFLVTSDGLLATNYHVINGGKKFQILFPRLKKEFPAKVVLKDQNNDLAILQLGDFSQAELGLEFLPYRVVRTQTLALGQKIFTIGYPLNTILGENAKYTDGSISSKSGIKDDPVHLQINANIQPGNSGSPLLSQDGEIVGVIVASLNATWMVQRFGILPQNVNFAIKSDYLLNLLDMMAEAPTIKVKINPKPDEIAKYMGLIKVYK